MEGHVFLLLYLFAMPSASHRHHLSIDHHHHQHLNNTTHQHSITSRLLPLGDIAANIITPPRNRTRQPTTVSLPPRLAHSRNIQKRRSSPTHHHNHGAVRWIPSTCPT